MTSAVTRVTAAPSSEALAHFERLLAYERDCWDVHHAITNERVDFVLLDVRNEAAYQQGHISGATHLAYSRINAQSLTQYTADTLFVVYCAGPHCNATEKAAIRLAKLGRPVKKLVVSQAGSMKDLN